jgi:hypothetical protein
MRKIHVLSTALVLAATIGSVAQAQGDQGRGRGRGRGDDKDRQVPQAEQQQRVKEEQRRTDDYRRHLDDQVRAAQAQAAQLQAARRTSQYRAQQEYAEQLARQQEQLRAERRYEAEPYVTAPRIYRYRFNDEYRETNQYGADLLRQAVNDGYRRGYRAGVADREDHWRADYANSPEYRDGTYGYTGSYVDLDDYGYYFRQGFRRGYEDGYYSRFRYGSGSNGTVSILAGVLGGILGLTTIR